MSNLRQEHSIIPSVYEELTGIGKAQQLEPGLFLLDMPTGSGKSWACIAVAKKYLQGEYLFKDKMWLISNQNKNLDDFVKELVPLGALRLKDQVSTVQDFFENHPDYIGDIRSCRCLSERATAQYLIELLTKMKEGVDQYGQSNSKDFNSYIRDEVVSKNLIAIKKKLGAIISSNIKKKLWSRAKIVEILKEEIPWSIDLFPDCKIDESKVIICTYKKFIFAQKSFPVGSQYLWEICKGDILMMDEFETSKKAFLDYSIDISLWNGYDIIKSFTSIRNNLISQTQPESIYAEKPYHKGIKKTKILAAIKAKFNKIYKDFQLEKNLKTSDDQKEKAFSNVIFSNQSIQLESKVSFLRYEKDRNYIDYKDHGTDDTVASLVYEISSAIHEFAKTIQYDFLPDYHEAAKSELTDYFDDLKSLYNTFGFDEECISYLLMQNKIIDLKRQLGIGKDKGLDSIYDSFPAMSYRIFENNPDNKEITVIKDYNVSYSPESWIVALAYENTVLGLSATSRIDSVFINYDLGFFRDKGILREIPFRIVMELEKEFDKRYDYNNNGLLDITVNVLDKTFEDVEKEYFLQQDVLKKKYAGILTDADMENPYINNFISADGEKYTMTQWHRLISAIHSYLSHGGFAMLALTNKKHFEDEGKKEAIKMIVERMKANLGITDEICVEFLFTDNFEESFSTIRDDKLNQGIRTIVLSNIEAVARGVNLTYSVTSDSLDRTVIVDHLNEYDVTDANFLKTCFDYMYIEHKTYVGPQYDQAETPVKTQKSFISFTYGLATMFDHRDESEITFRQIELYLRTALTLGSSMYPNPYRKFISEASSFSKAFYIYLAQIVGRITRTPRRTKKTCIILDDEWCQTDFEYIKKGNWVIPELRKIKEALENYSPITSIPPHSYATAQRNAMKLSNEYRTINYIVRTDTSRSEEYKKRLAELNDYILSHVTGSFTDDMVSDPNAKLTLMELPPGLREYNFVKSWHNAHRRVERFEIYDSPTVIKNREYFVCSLKSMQEKLDSVLQLPGLMTKFQEKGWQTVLPMPNGEINKKTYILNPEAFMKWEGLLGEISFEEFCKQHRIKAEPLADDIFEFADYSIGGKVAIDIKNWSWDINEPGMQEHICKNYDELQDAGFKALILINLFPMKDSEKFSVHQICGHDRNIFSFSCLASKTQETYNWNATAFQKLISAIKLYTEEKKTTA
ncbi:MAG: hypothetical protein IJ199_01540 [Prevotella sp.]|nr:hypothetical protein [Prevotella sp.]